MAKYRTPVGEKTSGNHELPAGKQEYRFSFRLPKDKLPSSYEGKYGAIRYWLLLQIDRPILRFNIERYKNVTVLDDIDVNLPEYSKVVGRKTEKKITKALGFGDQGVVELHAQMNRGAYCPGEKIALSLVANNKSERDIGMIKATLLQETSFRANGEEKHKTYRLQTITGKEMKSKEKRVWQDQLLTVPAIPATTRDRTCQIVQVRYYVKVLVDVAKLHGGDVVVLLPVTIGTIPQGYKNQAQQPAGASNVHVTDVSSVITYTQCNNGLEQFDKGENKFPKFSYIPWCAYVPNYTYRPASKVTPHTTPVNKKQVTKPVPSATPVSKTSLHTPSTNASPKTPSAPPVEMIAPPSYEDVMKEIGSSVTEKSRLVDMDNSEGVSDDSSSGNSQVNKPNDTQAVIVARPLTTKNVVLLVRFSDKYLNGFRTCVAQHGEYLGKCSGTIVALAPQVIVTSGCWPYRTSIAVFLFETKENGKKWFDEFNGACAAADVQLTDGSIINASLEEFQNEKNQFEITLIKKKTDINPKEIAPLMQKLNTWLRQILRPKRIEFGGVYLCAGKVSERLVGGWPESDEVISVGQWDSLKQYFDYLTTVRANKEVVELMKKWFDTVLKITFQTEDVSFIQESTIYEGNNEERFTTDERKELV